MNAHCEALSLTEYLPVWTPTLYLLIGREGTRVQLSLLTLGWGELHIRSGLNGEIEWSGRGGILTEDKNEVARLLETELSRTEIPFDPPTILQYLKPATIASLDESKPLRVSPVDPLVAALIPNLWFELLAPEAEQLLESSKEGWWVGDPLLYEASGGVRASLDCWRQSLKQRWFSLLNK